MSIWKLGFAGKSSLDALLDKPNVKFEEVMERDEVMQEVKATVDSKEKMKSSRIVKYLAQPEIVQQMITLCVEPPPSDASDKRKFRLPWVCCEVLMTDLPPVYEVLVSSKHLMDLLLSFLDGEPPLPSTCALAFVRVVQHLYTKRSADVADYLLNKGKDCIEPFITHIDTFGMNELVLTLLGAMDIDTHTGAPEEAGKVCEAWLKDGLVDLLIGRLDVEEPIDVKINILRMLCEVVRRFHFQSVRALATQLMEEEATNKFLDVMISHLPTEGGSVIFAECTNLLIAIIDSIVRTEELARMTRNELPQTEQGVTPGDATLNAIMRKASQFVQLLKDPSSMSATLPPVQYTFGTLSPPLGYMRLKMVELLLVIIKTRKDFIQREALTLGVVDTCVDLFFQYDMNNLLHILVEDMIGTILVSEDPESIRFLFEETKITDRIWDAVEADKKAAAEAENGRYIRKGYFGYIILIANRITTTSDSWVEEWLKGNAKWQELLEGHLREANQKENMDLGGSAATNTLTTSPTDDGSALATDNNRGDVLTGTDGPKAEEELPKTGANRYKLESSEEDGANGDEEPVEELSGDFDSPDKEDSRDDAFDARGFIVPEEAPPTAEDEWAGFDEKVIQDVSEGSPETASEPAAATPAPSSTPLEDDGDSSDEDEYSKYSSTNYWEVDYTTCRKGN